MKETQTLASQALALTSQATDDMMERSRKRQAAAISSVPIR